MKKFRLLKETRQSIEYLRKDQEGRISAMEGGRLQEEKEVARKYHDTVPDQRTIPCDSFGSLVQGLAWGR